MVLAAFRSFWKRQREAALDLAHHTKLGQGPHPQIQSLVTEVQTSLWGGIHPRVKDIPLCFWVEGTINLIVLSHLYRLEEKVLDSWACSVPLLPEGNILQAWAVPGLHWVEDKCSLGREEWGIDYIYLTFADCFLGKKNSRFSEKKWDQEREDGKYLV